MIIVCLIIKQNTYLDFREKKHMHSVLGPPFYTSGEGGGLQLHSSRPPAYATISSCLVKSSKATVRQQRRPWTEFAEPASLNH